MNVLFLIYMGHPSLQSQEALDYIKNCEEYKVHEWQVDLEISSGKLDLSLMGSVTKGVLALKGRDYREKLLETFPSMMAGCYMVRTPDIGRVTVLARGKEVEDVYLKLELVAAYEFGGRDLEAPMLKGHYKLDEILREN